MYYRMLTVSMIVLCSLLGALADDQFRPVTPAWLSAHTNDQTIRILDVRDTAVSLYHRFDPLQGDQSRQATAVVSLSSITPRLISSTWICSGTKKRCNTGTARFGSVCWPQVKISTAI